ncbi:MAG: guanylate kinase [Clostridiales bacterium]|nr:guanylate kinase [Clostridiales bacterium]
MIKRNGMLVVISGPSGVGKGTICKELFKRDLKDVKLSISATTRKPRIGEYEGINYYYKEEHEFDDMQKRGEFLEYAKVYGSYYGTPKKYVETNLNNGISVILEIDIQGAMQIKSNFKEAVFIFIMPPSYGELRKRIIGRATDSDDIINRRLKAALKEVKEVVKYDYVINNDKVDNVADKIICVLNAEKYRTSRCRFDFSKFKEESFD